MELCLLLIRFELHVVLDDPPQVLTIVFDNHFDLMHRTSIVGSMLSKIVDVSKGPVIASGQ